MKKFKMPEDCKKGKCLMLNDYCMKSAEFSAAWNELLLEFCKAFLIIPIKIINKINDKFCGKK